MDSPSASRSAHFRQTLSGAQSTSEEWSEYIDFSTTPPTLHRSLSGPATASVPLADTLAFTGSDTITVSDVDGGNSTESIALAVTSGTLMLATSGVTVNSGASGSSTVTITARSRSWNAALATLQYVAARYLALWHINSPRQRRPGQ